MRRLLTLFAALLTTTLALWANTIDRESARDKAKQLLGKPVSEVAAYQAGARSSSALSDGEDAYYMFNATDGPGFVILSAEDALGTVLGYSYDEQLPTDGRLPDALHQLLDVFSQITADFRNGSISAPTKASPHYLQGVPALISTRWDQGTPFNNLCPVIDEKHCLTGCVATAIGQIMKYWEWPVTGKGYASATVESEVVHGSLEHAYQWELMRNTRDELMESEPSATAVAELLYDCGLSVGMNYGLETSGSNLTLRALYANFGYIPTTLRTLRRDCYSSDEEWLQILRNELDNGRPIYYTARSKVDGSTETSGHAFVIDGYDSSSLLHVNWGWGGYCNGYFDLSLASGNGQVFNLNQAATIGIEPAKNGETGTPIEYPYMEMKPTCDRTGTISKSVDFSITVGGFWNYTSTSHSWTVSIGIYDINNKMLGDAKKRGGGVAALNLEPNYGYHDVYGAVICNLSSKTLANGHYALRVVLNEKNINILPDMAGGQENNAVYIQVNGSNITFTDGTAYKEAALAAGISVVEYSSDASQKYYDLQGRPVANPGRGIFIRDGRKVIR